MLLLRWWDHSDTFSFHFPRLPGLKGIFAGISDKNGGWCMLECLLCSLYSHKLPTFLQRHKTLCSKSHRAKRVSEKTWKGCYCIPSLRLQSYFHKMAHMWTLVCASVRQRVSLYKCNVNIGISIMKKANGLEIVLHRERLVQCIGAPSSSNLISRPVKMINKKITS